MGSFFKNEERWGKRMQKGDSKAGGESHQSIPKQSNLLGPPGTPPPALHLFSRRASSTEFFVLEKRPHGPHPSSRRPSLQAFPDGH